MTLRFDAYNISIAYLLESLGCFDLCVLLGSGSHRHVTVTICPHPLPLAIATVDFGKSDSYSNMYEHRPLQRRHPRLLARFNCCVKCASRTAEIDATVL